MEILGRLMVSLVFHAGVDAALESRLFLCCELWREEGEAPVKCPAVGHGWWVWPVKSSVHWDSRQDLYWTLLLTSCCSVCYAALLSFSSHSLSAVSDSTGLCCWSYEVIAEAQDHTSFSRLL